MLEQHWLAACTSTGRTLILSKMRCSASDPRVRWKESEQVASEMLHGLMSEKFCVNTRGSDRFAQ
jgi:hypothetical protein